NALEVLEVESEPEVGIRLGSTAGLTGLKNGLSSKITAFYLEEISFKTDKKTEIDCSNTDRHLYSIDRNACAPFQSLSNHIEGELEDIPKNLVLLDVSIHSGSKFPK
ncbi:3884_t:CDS:2, partial [Funneliformis mosseae]